MRAAVLCCIVSLRVRESLVDCGVPAWPALLTYRAITKTYVAYEDKAKLQKKGIWAGKFQKPSDWRKEAKAAEASAAAKATTAQHQRPQQPRPQPAQQLPLGPRPDQPAASSVGAGTGSKPSYAGVLGKH